MPKLMEKYRLKPGDFIIHRLKTPAASDPNIWIPEQVFNENDDYLYVLGGIIPKFDTEILPYKGNEELVRTDNSKWIPPLDGLVAAKFETSSGIEYWKPCVYMGRNADGKHTVKFHSGGSSVIGFVYVDIVEPIENHFKLSK